MAFRKSGCYSPVSPFEFRNNGELSSASSSISEISAESLDSDDELTPLSFSCSDIVGICEHDSKECSTNTVENVRQLKVAVSRSNSKIQDFTERMSLLHDAIGPLHLKSRLGKGLNDHIDRALEPAISVLNMFHSLHHLNRAVKAGPGRDVACYLTYVSRLEDAIVYINENFSRAVQGLNKVLEFLESNKAGDRFRIYKLNETVMTLRKLQVGIQEMSLDGSILEQSFEKLEKEFRSILVEHAQEGKFRFSALQALRLIVEKLIAKGRVNRLFDIYEHVRSTKARKSLMALHVDYLQNCTAESIDNLDWMTLEGDIAMWIEQMEMLDNLFTSERELCLLVFHAVDKGLWAECLGKVARNVGLESFLMYGEAVARSRKEPQKLFKLLDMFVVLGKLSQSLTEVFECEGCTEIRQQANEVQKRVVQGSCKAFFEFGLQVEVQRGSSPSNGSVLKLTSYVVNYLKYLVTDSYRLIISQVLRMEQGYRGLNPEEGDISLAVIGIMETLERTLEARAKTARDPAFRSFFLMNNYWYIFTRSKNSELDRLLGETWVNQIRQKAEGAALRYQKEAWGSVMSYLWGGTENSSNRISSKEAAAVVQRIRAFEDAFEKACQKHSQWIISNPELRQLVLKAVSQSLVMEYESYILRYRSVLQHGLLQYTAQSIQSIISELFEVQTDMNSINSSAYHNPFSGAYLASK